MLVINGTNNAGSLWLLDGISSAEISGASEVTLPGGAATINAWLAADLGVNSAVVGGLAFDRDNNHVYMLSSFGLDYSLIRFTLNPETGAVSNSSSVVITGARPRGLARSDDGTMYAVATSGRVYTLATTGVATEIGRLPSAALTNRNSIGIHNGLLWYIADPSAETLYSSSLTDPAGATSSGALPAGIYRALDSYDDTPALPDASAPTVAIGAVADGDEGTTVQLSATLSDGTYDEADYDWSVSGGTLNDDTSATPTWTRPAVAADTAFNIDLTVTARGTGTDAADGTEADASAATRTATVRNVLPDAVAPTVTLNSPGNVNEGTSVTLTDSVTGGTYDSLARAYQVISGGGSVNAAGQYTAPAVAAHTNVTVRITVTASGDGTDAAAGTSDTATDSVTFSVRNVPPVPVLTTDTDSVWRLATSQPATPTGGTGTQTHTPTGWTHVEPSATATEGVWRSQRTRSFSDGAFTSATAWGSPAETEAATGTPLLLTLADFPQPAGTEDECFALIERTGTGDTIYATSRRGGTDVPIDGDLTLAGGAPNGTDVERIRLVFDTLVLNDNDSPDVLSMSAYFGVGGAGRDLTMWVQDEFDTPQSMVVADAVGTLGGNFANFAPGFDFRTALNGIDVGDRFIIRFTRPTAPPTATEVEVEATGTLPLPTGTATVTLSAAPSPESVQATGSLPLPTATATVTLTAAPGPVAVQATATLPLPTATATVTLSAAPGPVQVQASATLPLPTGTATVTLTAAVEPVQVQATGTLPTLTATATVTPSAAVEPVQVEATATLPAPTGTATVTLTAAPPLAVEATGSLPPPTGTATVTLTAAPGQESVQATGTLPLLTGTATVTPSAAVEPVQVEATATLPLPTATATVTLTAAPGPVAVEATATLPTPMGAATVTVFTPLSLAAWTQPALTENLVLALVVARVSGVDFVSIAANPGDLLDGELVVADDLPLDQLERHASPHALIRLRHTGTAGFSDYFGTTALFPDAKLYIQTDTDEVWAFTHRNSGGGYSNWNEDDGAAVAVINAIATGDRLIWGITSPVSAAVAVQASGEIPAVTGAATVTLTAAPGPVAVQATGTLPTLTATATVTLTAVPAPEAVEATGTLPLPTGTATVTPSAAPGPVSVQATGTLPLLSGTATVTLRTPPPGEVQSNGTLPTPTGTATVTLTAAPAPEAVQATGTLPLPTGTATVTPSAAPSPESVQATGTLPLPTGTATVTLTAAPGPVAVEATGSLPLPTGTATVTPSAALEPVQVQATATLPLPTGVATVMLSAAPPLAVEATGTLPLPTGTATVTLTAAPGQESVQATGTLPLLTGTATVTPSAAVEPVQVEAQGTLPLPTGTATVSAALGPVQVEATATLPPPTGTATVTLSAAPAQVAVHLGGLADFTDFEMEGIHEIIEPPVPFANPALCGPLMVEQLLQDCNSVTEQSGCFPDNLSIPISTFLGGCTLIDLELSGVLVEVPGAIELGGLLALDDFDTTGSLTQGSLLGGLLDIDELDTQGSLSFYGTALGGLLDIDELDTTGSLSFYGTLLGGLLDIDELDTQGSLSFYGTALGGLLDLDDFDTTGSLRVTIQTELGGLLDIDELDTQGSLRATAIQTELGGLLDIDELDTQGSLRATAIQIELGGLASMDEFDTTGSLSVGGRVDLGGLIGLEDFDTTGELAVGKGTPRGDRALLGGLAGIDDFDTAGSLSVGAASAALTVFSNPSSLTGIPGTSLTAQLGATGGTAPYTFSKVSGKAWLSTTDSGAITGTIPANQALGPASAIFRVTDGNSATATVTFTVNVTAAPVSLSLSVSPTMIHLGAGGTAQAQLTASGGAGGYLYYRSEGPSWITVGTLTGVVTIQAPVSGSGEMTVTFGVFSGGATAEVMFTATVGPVAVEATATLPLPTGTATVMPSAAPGSPSVQATGTLPPPTGTATVTLTAAPVSLSLSVSPTMIHLGAGGTAQAQLTASGGAGGYLYYRSEGPSWITVGTLTGVVTIQAPVSGSGETTATFGVFSGGATAEVMFTATVGQRDISRDFSVPGSLIEGSLTGAATDGSHIWLIDRDEPNQGRAHAYLINASSAPSRDSTRDFLIDSARDDPQSACTDGTHIWVGDRDFSPTTEGFTAYRIQSNGAPTRDSTKDFQLPDGSANADSSACDGSHIWVFDLGGLGVGVTAWEISNSGAPTRDSTREFDIASDLGDGFRTVAACTDDTHIWVGDAVGDGATVYAYRIQSNGAPTRDSTKDFNLEAAHQRPNALCTDGTTIWAVRSLTAYAYRVP